MYIVVQGRGLGRMKIWIEEIKKTWLPLSNWGYDYGQPQWKEIARMFELRNQGKIFLCVDSLNDLCIFWSDISNIALWRFWILYIQNIIGQFWLSLLWILTTCVIFIYLTVLYGVLVMAIAYWRKWVGRHYHSSTYTFCPWVWILLFLLGNKL